MPTKVIKFNSFNEFFDKQLSSDSYFYSVCDNFVYRGIYGDFDLVPKALRDSGARYRTYSEQRDYEINYLEQFLHFSILNNQNIPSSVINAKNNRLIAVNADLWLPVEYEELAALAQHYGVPTRLLDWSKEINVAMYFASIGAIQAIHNKSKVEPYVVIWACNLNIANYEVLKGDVNNPLSFVEPPYCNNLNLEAQVGVLTAWRRKIEGNEDDITEIKPLNFLVDEYYKNDETFYKFILPVDSCYDMFDYVNKENYNAARLFPGYGGVQKHIEELEMCETKLKSKEFIVSLK
jgi:hypothetical protein